MRSRWPWVVLLVVFAALASLLWFDCRAVARWVALPCAVAAVWCVNRIEGGR